MPLNPVIPSTITVHLGTPQSNAENVTVPFVEYVKNVASSEIYPTWPESALRANIYAITTYALNRIYTEWYKSQGYDFDITNSTQFDQAFVKDRAIFENISRITDEIFDSYVAEQGSVQPFFTQFCNGTTSTCDGLSQWGTVSLAERGFTPYEILTNYYGDNINIINDAPVADVSESYPGTPLRLGDSGNDVQIIQTQLKSITRNYPAIGFTALPSGIFDVYTEEAVKRFQEVFFLNVTGEVDKATWYKIKRLFVGVRRLAELNSIGITIEEASLPYETELSEGSSGNQVRAIQYYLNVIAYFNNSLNTLPIDGVYGVDTLNAVNNFQQFYGLKVSGVVDRETFNKIREVYNSIIENLPPDYTGGKAVLYPGYVLSVGMRGENVRNLQTYLAAISSYIPSLGNIAVDGIFGPATERAVREFQRLFGLPVTGSVGPWTWYYIAREYDNI